MIEADRAVQKKEELSLRQFLISSGGRTRTSDLRVMSPTSYQLLYPAMLLDYKGNYYFNKCKIFVDIFRSIFFVNYFDDPDCRE